MYKSDRFSVNFKSVFVLGFILLTNLIYSQSKPKNDFWNKVQIGGGFALSVGSGYTNISVAPSAIYNFNKIFAAGVGLQGSYVKVNDQDARYNSFIYGGSLIGLANPIPQIQLSVELEELRVNQEFPDFNAKDNFWNTALYLGAGYTNGKVTVGIRYNILFDKKDYVYSEAFMPFVRIYF